MYQLLTTLYTITQALPGVWHEAMNYLFDLALMFMVTYPAQGAL